MKKLKELKENIKLHRHQLQQTFKVKSIAIFGSYTKNEQTDQSDVDILVEFEEPVGLLFIHLADFLEEILGTKVDLLTPDAVKPNRHKYIMEGLSYV